jgi:hypothetical protein
MLVIGCDPGVTGALSLFCGTALLDLRDIPNVKIVTEAKGADLRDLIGGPKEHRKFRVDPIGLAALLRDWRVQHNVRLVREKVHPRGGQGAVSSGVLMEVVGIIDGVAAALGIEVHTVDPTTWKRAMGLTDDKKLSCKRAAQEFPKWKESFKRTSIDDDKAEAALLGLYGVRHPRMT